MNAAVARQQRARIRARKEAMEKKKAMKKKTGKEIKLEWAQHKRKKTVEISTVRRRFTDRQIQALQDVFDACDDDKSGFLMGRLELSNALRRLGIYPNREELNELMAVADNDANGALDFDEFVVYVADRLQQPHTFDDMVDSFELLEEPDAPGMVDPAKLRDTLMFLLTSRTDDGATAAASAALAAQGAGGNLEEMVDLALLHELIQEIEEKFERDENGFVRSDEITAMLVGPLT